MGKQPNRIHGSLIWSPSITHMLLTSALAQVQGATVFSFTAYRYQNHWSWYTYYTQCHLNPNANSNMRLVIIPRLYKFKVDTLRKYFEKVLLNNQCLFKLALRIWFHQKTPWDLMPNWLKLEVFGWTCKNLRYFFAKHGMHEFSSKVNVNIE